MYRFRSWFLSVILVALLLVVLYFLFPQRSQFLFEWGLSNLEIVLTIITAICGFLAWWYARNAALWGKRTYLLELERTKTRPILDIIPRPRHEWPLVVRIQERVTGRFQRYLRIFRKLFTFGLMDWEYVSIVVRNSGGVSANRVVGKLKFDVDFLHPIMHGMNEGILLKEDDIIAMPPLFRFVLSNLLAVFPYFIWRSLGKRSLIQRVHVSYDRLSAGTSWLIIIPVIAFSEGATRVEYHFLCDEGVEVSGNIPLQVVVDSSEPAART